MTTAPQLTPTPPPVPFRRRPLFTPYVVMWTLGGIFAAIYMVVAMASPDLLEDLTPSSSVIADPQSNQGQRASARLAAEINALRDSISQVQLDLAKVKTDVASHGARERDLTAQLVALEKKLASNEQHAIETTEPGAGLVAAPQREADAGQIEMQHELRVDAPGLTLTPPSPSQPDDMQSVVAPAQPKLINADASARPAVETATVKAPAKADAKAAADAKAPRQRPSRRPLSVQLPSRSALCCRRGLRSTSTLELEPAGRPPRRCAEEHAGALRHERRRRQPELRSDRRTDQVQGGGAKSVQDASGTQHRL